MYVCGCVSGIVRMMTGRETLPLLSSSLLSCSLFLSREQEETPALLPALTHHSKPIRLDIQTDSHQRNNDTTNDAALATHTLSLFDASTQIAMDDDAVVPLGALCGAILRDYCEGTK